MIKTIKIQARAFKVYSSGLVYDFNGDICKIYEYKGEFKIETPIGNFKLLEVVNKAFPEFNLSNFHIDIYKNELDNIRLEKINLINSWFNERAKDLKQTYEERLEKLLQDYKFKKDNIEEDYEKRS